MTHFNYPMLNPEEIQRRYYTDIAAHYDEMYVGDADENQIALRYISQFLNSMDVTSILDVGCGTGRGVKYFAEQYPHFQVMGVEPVPALIEQAIQQHGIAAEQLICGKGENLPFAEKSFDVVCEFAMLHHVPNPNAIVREMTRVARKAIFISDSNRFGQGRMVARWFKLLLYKAGLWGLFNYVRTGGKVYMLTKGDGLAYSYSVFDSYNLLATWADRLILIPTGYEKKLSWCHPLLTSSHILVCAFKE